jgi:hypothetical protein
MILNKTNPRECVVIMMNMVVIVGLFLLLQPAIDPGALTFSTALISFTQAASTHVLRPWNIMATLTKIALGKYSPIFKNR